MMKVQTIRSWPELDALSDEWNVLLERSEAKSIFLTWEWMKSWRHAIDDSVKPYVIIVRAANDELIGIAPLYVASIKVFGIFNFRTLRYMADAATGAEYPDWIADADHEAEICDAIANQLRDNSNDWDVIWLSNIAGWTGAEKRIKDSAQRKGLSVRGRCRAFAHVDLPEDILAFERQFSAKSRQRLRRNSRRILKTPGVEVVMCSDPDDLSDYLTALFELHQLRWKSAGVDGSFQRQPVVEHFYRQMAPIALRKGWLRLFVLKQDDVVKAVQFGYVFDGSYLQIQEGFDPEYQPGTGNALRHCVIENCLESGIRHYDFLAGASEHKRRWGGVVRNGFDWLVTNNSLRSRFVSFTGMWPTGRFMQEKGLVTGATHR